jgi:hypothetical protein
MMSKNTWYKVIYTNVGVVPIGICKFRLKPFMIASKKPSWCNVKNSIDPVKDEIHQQDFMDFRGSLEFRFKWYFT